MRTANPSPRTPRLFARRGSRGRPQPARGWDLLTGQAQPSLRPTIDLALLYVAAASQPAAGDGTLTHSTVLLAYPLLVVAVAAVRGVYRAARGRRVSTPRAPLWSRR